MPLPRWLGRDHPNKLDVRDQRSATGQQISLEV
jgi:hypothetical protein